MNFQVYQGVQRDDAVCKLKHRRRWMMQQDNPGHQSESATEWIQRHKIHLLECLSQRPDLSRIESLCNNHRSIHIRHPHNMAELKLFYRAE